MNKTIVDHLRKQRNGIDSFEVSQWKDSEKKFVHTDIGFSLRKDCIHLFINGDLKTILELDHVEDQIQDYLFDNYGIEIRFCDHCGCPMDCGYTDDEGSFYNCKECFPEDMNNRYGEGNWRSVENGKPNSLGGYYEYYEDGEWVEEPSYYTEWN